MLRHEKPRNPCPSSPWNIAALPTAAPQSSWKAGRPSQEKAVTFQDLSIHFAERALAIPTIKMINFACGFFDQDNDRWYQRPFKEPEGGSIKKAQKCKAWFRSKIPKLAKTCQNPKLNKLRLSTSQAQNKIIQLMLSCLQATHIEGATAPWECSIDATRQHEKHTSFTNSPPDRFYWGKSCHCIYLEDLQSTSHNKSPTACYGIPQKFSISVWLFDDDLCGLVTSKLCLPAPEMSSPVPTPKLAVAKRPPDT